jgi:hypothetical protein
MLYIIPVFFFFLPIVTDWLIQFMNWFVFARGLTRQEATLEESVIRNTPFFIYDIIWKASTILITIYIIMRNRITSDDKTSRKSI